ncbi:DUF429 domain-containing protein [Demequina sp. TTPB684]|uniref:DUF429 domain-containing protein n=1 Tax=unclassified Demequina TaxID=2620311 RepID=UPI001CF47C03|nr:MULTISPECIES: DUF429 domain-containing protein [unclassified Demequina]MCB2413077.1 DUF429 domain-containing protein [Demequina sp. TTPB684]UPU88115.1 DUF429 domain-containing protein [Demequina sp. TMPB413]
MTVLGLDGCKKGWVVAVAESGRLIDMFIAKDVGQAIDVAGRRWDIDAVVIDMPIGLADTIPRVADEQARQRLGERRSSVFDVPIRKALEAGSTAEANRISKEITGRGVGSMSYALRDKVFEIDEFVRSASVTVREGHPEVSFAGLAGRPLSYYKKTLPGALERRALLESVGLLPAVDAEIALKRQAAFDDINDAAIMAWTALRVTAGEAESLPETPGVFSMDGRAPSGSRSRRR